MSAAPSVEILGIDIVLLPEIFHKQKIITVILLSTKIENSYKNPYDSNSHETFEFLLINK